MVKNFLSLDSVRSYGIASKLSDEIWDIVSKWDWFARKTLGSQYVNAIDSIAGNLAEGFGRFHKKDKEKFYYNSRGSAYESIHWTEKAKIRKLLKSDEYDKIIEALNSLPREINWLIKVTEEKLKI